MTTTPDIAGLIERLNERLRKEAARQNSAYDRYGMDNTPQSVDPDVWQAAAALQSLQQDNEKLEQALRLKIWGDCRARGMSEDDAQKQADETIAALLSSGGDK